MVNKQEPVRGDTVSTGYELSPERRDRFTAQAEDFEIVSPPPVKRAGKKPQTGVSAKRDADKI